ncbi:hypothetical protein [Amycolatopsis circi]|uniref:hypothetical protein n=1 Tax=Amycolatopsis circi TaxID=871959 RepID=UPI000E286DA1|nr:hypothetical protein [Amycolatopsis circi]
MPQHTIKTPVADYTGTVAGVRFTAGRGETGDENAVAYFQRQGYTVTPVEDDIEPDEHPADDPPVDTAPVDETAVDASPAADGAKRTNRRTPAK